jgi:hypothetical protein
MNLLKYQPTTRPVLDVLINYYSITAQDREFIYKVWEMSPLTHIYVVLRGEPHYLRFRTRELGHTITENISLDFHLHWECQVSFRASAGFEHILPPDWYAVGNNDEKLFFAKSIKALK